uniref:Pre-mRNA-processing factor 17 n=1 Tax=Alexandrium catenella TaxID=2925 RepID=A0A7S1S208_ALECA|mmetsp:Transcript_83047/g.220330  ORF Transcript_83047/g.220330 Transcript_83047/m.220330 type:complete len:595 (+) Transcript_83047:22-1806(+)
MGGWTDLLAEYGDEEEEVAPADVAPKVDVAAKARGAVPKAKARGAPVGVEALLPMVDPAPLVDLLGMDEVQNFAVAPSKKKIFTNPSFAALNKPLQGPLQVGKRSLEQQFVNHKLGHVEKAHMSSFAFDEQYHTFHNFGYAANPARSVPTGEQRLLSTEATPQEGRTIWDKAAKRRRSGNEAEEAVKAPRAEKSEEKAESDEEKEDPSAQWGGFVDSAIVQRQLEMEVRTREEEVTRQKEEEKAVAGEERETKERITSIFHGSKETDYCGRSWIENRAQAPKDVDERQCFLPKKWIHTWTGHTMGVQQIRWFPNTAHLLLSAGMDGTVKIWDYYNQRKCLRTYMGHDQAVRDVNFTSDGRRFYSVSFDKNIQYWDTETGQVISTFTNKKTPFCVAVHPNPSQQNIIVCGCSNKKAVQWDSNSANIVQEYDEHLGAVNTVTFCEEGKRLVTTSDDKKIFVWEYGIPVVIKHIAEPTMHSVPAVTVNPQKKYLIGQSLDNKIISYEAGGRFKFMGKKQFKGHMNSGYAITPGFSADGHWVMSGDVDGKIWFWDWQKMKNYRVLKAHDGVCISCLWHPVQPSRVVTCGWDGMIKLWD